MAVDGEFRRALPLDGSASVGAGTRLLNDVSDETDVVVRWRLPNETRWYRFTRAQLMQILAEASADSTVGESLDLDALRVEEVVEIDDLPSREGGGPCIVLDRRRLVGVFEPVAHQAAVPDAPAAPRRSSGPRRRGVRRGTTRGARRTRGIPMRGTVDAEEPTDTGTSGFKAHPDIAAPTSVAPSEAFSVEVGISPEQQVDGGEMFVVPTTEGDFTIDVELLAPDFVSTGPRSGQLTVTADDPYGSTVVFDLVAPDKPQHDLSVVVQYSFRGTVLDRVTWPVAVVAAGDTPPPHTPTSGLFPVAEQALPADLTITIEVGADDRSLALSFSTPLDVALPEPPEPVRFDEDDAESFALGQIAQAAKAHDTPLVMNHMMGIARSVAGVLPVEFYTALATVWANTATEGRPPSVLVISSEPYVPWELASVEKDFIVDQALVDPARPLILGAQVRVGRWTPPGRKTPAGTQRPKPLPATGCRVGRIAIVASDYTETSGVPELEEATKEAADLAARYPSIELGVSSTDILALINDQLTENGEPIDFEAVHFACHGEVDPRNPLRNGIVLTDTQTRFDEVVLLGANFDEERPPFVFLNACQLAQRGTENLAQYGGMAGGFLKAGAPGFIAPLWAVKDTVAREMAVEFYQRTLQDGVAVGEALRELRSKFSSGPEPSSTYLAYVYFGHPNMVLALA